jgi:hypothetical protein
MRSLILASAAVLIFSCNEKPSSEATVNKPVTDLAGENLKGKVVQIETNTYLVDSATGQKGKLESKSIEKYDDNGYSNYYSNFTAKDSSTTVSTYERNSNGYMTQYTSTKNGKPLSSLKLTLDSAGKYSLAVSYDSTGKEDVFYDSIVTNNYGEVLSAKGHHPDSTLKMTFANDFDSIYYIGGENKDSVGKTTYSAAIKLNDKKDPQEMDETTITKDSATKKNTVYTYNTSDNNGNWILQTIAENGKPKKIVERTITYK